jgi:hypothetical protein
MVLQLFLKEEYRVNSTLQESAMTPLIHPWLRKISFAFVPGPTTPLLEEVATNLLQSFRSHGHAFQTTPDDTTDVILTTAPFGEAVNWRKAVLLSARQRFKLSHTPAVYALLHAPRAEFQRLLDHFHVALAKEQPDPADYDFPGLAPGAYRVLHQQARRGGPILALERLVQVQSKCIRVLLLVGDERPHALFHFDLVGAHPASKADDLASFYDDIVLRIVTTVCSSEVTEHQVVDSPIPYSLWQSLDTPEAMQTAAKRLGERSFFTEMVRINDLVQVPSVGDTVSDQYSEGCFSTWDPTLGALIATVTGSARPLTKDKVTEDDLAVIVGVRPDGNGVLVRHVEGKDNVPPSSESVEMIGMDGLLPTISLTKDQEPPAQVPVLRSKLHGHRGIAAYDPEHVEFAPLSPPYYHYLVSCATDAQAWGIQEAFARAASLQNPADPRQVAFTVLPGHGVVIVEKWVAGKAPFQVIWEHMDAGYLQVHRQVPQGPVTYTPGPDGRLFVTTSQDILGTTPEGGFDKSSETG